MMPRENDMAANPRYDGKPLLKLLELYVLKAIGKLPRNEEDLLNAMAPKLQAISGGGGQWHEAIESAVRMDADTPQQLRDMWTRNLEIARASGVKLTPQKFAEMIVDENFPLD
jgi:hypothetical protein